MKLLIYVTLLGLLIFYIYKQSCYLNENFDDFSKSNFDSPNPYDILKNPQVKAMLINGDSNTVPAYDSTNNIYNNKPWVIKSDGFSDIFNYDDNGGSMIYNQVNIPSGFDRNKVMETNKKLLDDAKKEDQPKQSKAKSYPPTVDYQNNKYNLIGSASNPYYQQYYLIYERRVETKENLEMREELEFINYQVFEYLLVKIDNNKPEIAHNIGQRIKININDVVYLALGTFQIGPLVIKSLE